MTMTWGEFKQKAEEAGITDTMPIHYIDISDPEVGPGYGGVDFHPSNEKEGVVICQ